MTMESLLILVALIAAGWLLVGPVLLIQLWSRVGRIEDELRRQARERRRLEQAQPSGATVASAPKPAAATLPTFGEPLTAAAIAAIGSPPQEPASLGKVTAPTSPALPSSDPSNLPSPSTPAAAPTSGFSLEELLAGQWLTWVGAIAVVIGVGFFFKYSIDQELIGPTGRVAIGLLTGMVALAGGAFAMARNYRFFAQGLVGAALGILYFSLFAAFAWYDILPQLEAFVGMAIVTAIALAFSAYFDAQPTAMLGLLGGFLTPLMLSTGQDNQWGLFSYILLLDLGVLGIATFRKWQPLQVSAFLLTLLVWLGWFDRHYAPEKLIDTLILMTAFFLLFALLGIWHNVVRRKRAEPGDFGLILATPVAYFVGLYWVTESDYAYLHGLLAVALGAIYLVLGLFALMRNPAGQTVTLALGGVAASFLTVAIPLQLTGHWIVIAWAIESLLLVEIGLRFREPRLRYAGLGLLVVVLGILVYYGGETIDNPGYFDTRFTRQAHDPTMIVTTETPWTDMPTDDGDQLRPWWTEIVNGRALSFLISTAVMFVMAWEYRRRPDLLAEPSPLPEKAHVQWSPAWTATLLTALVPISILAMLMLETASLGDRRNWLTTSLVSMFCVWTALVTIGVLIFAAAQGSRMMGLLALGGFALLTVMLGSAFLETLSFWRSDWARLADAEPSARLWRIPIANPRGLGYAVAIAAAIAGALVCRRAAVNTLLAGSPGLAKTPLAKTPLAKLKMHELLGMFAYITGFAMLTVETYALGVVRGWETATALGVTFVWTLYAIATLVVGIYYRVAMVRISALALFLLTTGKVFLYDVWHIHATIRMLAFVVLGVSLLLVSYLYRRYHERIRAWIQPLAILLVLSATCHGCAKNACAQRPRRGAELVHTFSHRWPLPPTSDDTRLTRYVLPLDIYGVARRDLGDLRVITTEGKQSWSEVAYVLVEPKDSSRLAEHVAPLLNLSQLAGKTEFLLELANAAEPINRIEIVIAAEERNYERGVAVFGADRRDAADWNLLTQDAYLLDVTRPGNHFRVSHVDFPRSTFRFYKVQIDNRQQPPLAVQGAKLFYREKIEASRQSAPGVIVSQEANADRRESQVIFDLQHDQLPISEMHFEVDYQGDFYRPARIEIAQKLEPHANWRPIGSGQLYRIDRSKVKAAETHVKFAETPARYVRVVITNGDDAPLTIKTGIAKIIAKSVVITNGSIAGQGSPSLYAGNPKLLPPNYDLERTLGDLDDRVLPEHTLGPGEKNPAFTGHVPDPVPWSERNRPLLWAATIVGVVVLGCLTILLLRKAAIGEPSQSELEDRPEK